MFNKQTLKKLENKKIALLGLGLENKALLSLLDKEKIKTKITICDKRSKKDLNFPVLKNLRLKYQLGISFNRNLYKFDYLFRSPGWPLFCPGIDEAKKHQQTTITSPLNLFFSLYSNTNIIGVTGTKGKGTTASLIYAILKKANKDVVLGGNIGIAPLSLIKKIKTNTYIVLELSSFQLEDLQHSPHISVITNFYNEHLAPADPNNPNFHYSTQDYWQAKLQIVKHQTRKDYLVINTTLKQKIQRKNIKNIIKYFSSNNTPSKLTGDFNKENIAAAIAVAKILRIPANTYRKALKNFSNLEHRLELVETIDKVEYYDNSFSTTPESTILDLQSFNKPIILIAGGADKGADFKQLARTIKKHTKYIILLPGGATPRIKKELLSLGFMKNKIKEVKNMSEAVTVAYKQAEQNNVVLLSTACASFGIFKNYKERGNLFKQHVKEIYQQ